MHFDSLSLKQQGLVVSLLAALWASGCGGSVSGGGAGGTGASAGASGGVGGCALVDCSAPECDPGYVAQQAPDACCPVCVPTVCTEGQLGYDTLLGTLLDRPGAVACKVDKDCALLASSAYAGNPCPSVPVNAAAAPSINAELSSFANDNCSTCSPIYVLCPASPLPFCFEGRCMLPAIDK